MATRKAREHKFLEAADSIMDSMSLYSDKEYMVLADFMAVLQRVLSIHECAAATTIPCDFCQRLQSVVRHAASRWDEILAIRATAP